MNYDALPETVGEWTRERCQNGHGDHIGASYTAVVPTGEKAIVTACDTAKDGSNWSAYSMYKKPDEDDPDNWVGIHNMEDRGYFESQRDAYNALLAVVKTTSPGDIVGAQQVSLDDFGGASA